MCCVCVSGISADLRVVSGVCVCVWYVWCSGSPNISFFKTLFKGKNFAVRRVRERGKFDFDHYFAFLTNFLKR